jgi:hypothetical protein
MQSQAFPLTNNGFKVPVVPSFKEKDNQEARLYQQNREASSA